MKLMRCLVNALIVVTAAFTFTFPALALDAKANTKIMVYGDSLSAAYGINPSQGWVNLMQATLANKNVTIVNASISGETTTGGASRIKTDLARHKPNIVLLALGANDGLRGLPIGEMRKNLVKMLAEIKRANASAIIVGIQIPPNYGIDYAMQFKSMFASLAKKQKLPLVPFLLDGIAENLDNFQSDRLHPTAAAQPRILANVLPVIERSLLTKPVTKSK